MNKKQRAYLKYQKQLLIIKLQNNGMNNFTVNDDLSININDQVFTSHDSEALNIHTINGHYNTNSTKNLPKVINGDLRLYDEIKCYKTESIITGLVIINDSSKLLDVKTYNLIPYEFSETVRNVLSPQFNDSAPLSKLMKSIVISLIAFTPMKDKDKIPSKRYDILSRINEFDVIKNGDAIDYLSLSQLFDFYNVDMQKTKFSNQTFKDELKSWGYKIIE